jgi:hypothetical protein
VGPGKFGLECLPSDLDLNGLEFLECILGDLCSKVLGLVVGDVTWVLVPSVTVHPLLRETWDVSLRSLFEGY